MKDRKAAGMLSASVSQARNQFWTPQVLAS